MPLDSIFHIQQLEQTTENPKAKTYPDTDKDAKNQTKQNAKQNPEKIHTHKKKSPKTIRKWFKIVGAGTKLSSVIMNKKRKK